jgi:hypothetical protein
MTYRMEVLENIFEAQHKEVFRQRRQLKDLSAELFESKYICEYLREVHKVDFEDFDTLEYDAELDANKLKTKPKTTGTATGTSTGTAGTKTSTSPTAKTSAIAAAAAAASAAAAAATLAERFKVHADIVCTRMGNAMMVTVSLVVTASENNKPLAVAIPPPSKTHTPVASKGRPSVAYKGRPTATTATTRPTAKASMSYGRKTSTNRTPPRTPPSTHNRNSHIHTSTTSPTSTSPTTPTTPTPVLKHRDQAVYRIYDMDGGKWANDIAARPLVLLPHEVLLLLVLLYYASICCAMLYCAVL